MLHKASVPVYCVSNLNLPASRLHRDALCLTPFFGSHKARGLTPPQVLSSELTLSCTALVAADLVPTAHSRYQGDSLNTLQPSGCNTMPLPLSARELLDFSPESGFVILKGENSFSLSPIISD